jgi:hypothetical protein
MNKYIYSILVLVLLSGCISRSSSVEAFDANEGMSLKEDEKIKIIGQLDTIKVPKINPKEESLCCLEQLFDSLYIVHLETNENSIIGNINSITIMRDTIYILDSWKTKSLFQFDMNGKFIRKFGRNGNGPGEFVEPTNATINDSLVLIYDQWQQKVIKFDHNGKILSDRVLPFMCNNVMMLENGDILCYGNNSDNVNIPFILNYDFWQCDSHYTKISKVGFFRKYGKYVSFIGHYFYNYNNNQFFFDYKTNSFYQIHFNGEFESKYKLLFQPEPDEKFFQDDYYMTQCIKDGKGFGVYDFIAFDKYAVYTLATSGLAQFVFHNLSDNTVLYCNAINSPETQMSRVLLISSTKTVYKNMIVYNVSPAKIIMANKIFSKHYDLNKGAAKEMIASDKKLLESLQEDDNDILVFAKLKEHFTK